MAEIFNDLDISRPYFNSVVRVRGEYTRTGYLSATSAPDPPRISILERRYDDKIKIPVSRLIPSYIGTVLHKEIEKSEAEDYAPEREFVIDVDGVPFSGRPDFVFKGKRIGDYKFTSTYGWLNGIKEEYIIQAHINSYLARMNGVPIEDAWIEMTFLDWSKGKGTWNSDYPRRVEKYLVDDLRPDKDVLRYIKERIMLHKSCENLPDELLPHCTPKERWESGHCFAVTKKGGKRAVKGGRCDTEEAAMDLVKTLGRRHYTYEERRGEPKRCLDWCNAAQFCPQHQEEVSL